MYTVRFLDVIGTALRLLWDQRVTGEICVSSCFTVRH
jgi:hypothetical protein